MSNRWKSELWIAAWIAGLGSVHCGSDTASVPVGGSPSGGTETAGTAPTGSPAGAGAAAVPPSTAMVGSVANAVGGSDALPPPREITEGSASTEAGYINLAPALGEPLSPEGAAALSPPPPPGWSWYPIDGARCRDGSPAGFFVRWGTGEGLLWYLEGGGACSSPGFCNFNPPNVNTALSGDGQTVLGSTLGPVPARQQPGVFEGGLIAGIFANENPENPFADWSAIYTPYCTGDVHFGTRENGLVPGMQEPQQFVGHLNMQKFVARVVPTFRNSVDRVVLTGASAGSFGAALNFSMVQDAFEDVPVDAILDSGVPFTDMYMPPCLQQYWRDLWGFENSLPPDCEECFQADGGGLLGLADFLMQKHPRARIAAVSSTQDEVIRLFFSAGLNDCTSVTTADPVAITLGQIMPNVLMDGPSYQAALEEVRAIYAPTGRLASYMIGGTNATLHQHTWRQRFFEPAAGGTTIATFVTGFLAGESNQIGP